MHLFSILALLLMGHVTTTAGQLDNYRKDEHVCPGHSFRIARLSFSERLFFKSSIPGSSAKQVANRTHILLPSYQFKDKYVSIPVVMRQHEGFYFRVYEFVTLPIPVVTLILKDCSVRGEVPYGETFSLVVPEEASILEFTTSKSTDRRVLWSRINTDNRRGARGTVTRDRWKAVKITKADEGRYTFLTEYGAEVSSTRLVVTELNKQYDCTSEDIEKMEFPVPVPFAEAVLTFIDSSKNKHVLFQNALVTDNAFLIFGSRIDLRAEYGELVLTVKDLKSSDKGQYEVHDKNKDRAVVLYVYDSSASYNNEVVMPNIVSIIGSLMSLLFCCCCCLLRKPCCKKSDPPVDSPAPVQPVHDPVHMPTPAYSPPHQPVTMESADRRPWLQPNAHYRDSQPPPYSEVAGSSSEPCYPYTPAAPSWASVGGGTGSGGGTAAGTGGVGGTGGGAAGTGGGAGGAGTGEGTGGTGGAGADTNPSAPSAPLDPGPQYQFRGWGGGSGDFLSSSALSMDTNTGASAYNSDKLNF